MCHALCQAGPGSLPTAAKGSGECASAPLVWQIGAELPSNERVLLMVVHSSLCKSQALGPRTPMQGCMHARVQPAQLAAVSRPGGGLPCARRGVIQGPVRPAHQQRAHPAGAVQLPPEGACRGRSCCTCCAQRRGPAAAPAPGPSAASGTAPSRPLPASAGSQCPGWRQAPQAGSIVSSARLRSGTCKRA